MTMQYQAQIALGNLPLHLVIISDSTVAFSLRGNFKVIADNYSEGKVRGVYDSQGFSLDGEPFMYNTKYSYKEIPTLLKWLQEQELEMPS